MGCGSGVICIFRVQIPSFFECEEFQVWISGLVLETAKYAEVQISCKDGIGINTVWNQCHSLFMGFQTSRKKPCAKSVES